MTSTPRRVPPRHQPLRPAIALMVVALLVALTRLIGLVVPHLAGGGVEYVLGTETATSVLVLVLVTLVFLVFVLGLGLASFVLSIIVAVKGDGKLRLGAALLLASSLLGFVVSFTVSGDSSQLPDAALRIADLFSALELLADVAQGIVMLAGLLVLLLGIGEVRRARARHPRG